MFGMKYQKYIFVVVTKPGSKLKLLKLYVLIPTN